MERELTSNRLTERAAIGDEKRWKALTVLCLGALMMILDGSIVNIALPSIKADLDFSEQSLVWVVNAYLLTFAGGLLPAGRLGDFLGQRSVFLWGIMIFTLASLCCGIGNSPGLLIAARAVQGVGGAMVSAVALSLTMNLFTEVSERAKAMGIYSFVAVGGNTIALLLGGVLTNALNWRWIFLINLPVGAIVYVLGKGRLPDGLRHKGASHLDIAGAVTVTTALVLAAYTIMSAHTWSFARNLELAAAAAAFLLLFFAVETRVSQPLVPLDLFRRRNLVVAVVIGVLFGAAMFAWYFISTLYLQLVLGYSPLKAGLAFFPANVITALFSFGISPKIAGRFGIKLPLATGLMLSALGFLLFARAPLAGNFIADVLPGMLLLGLSIGMASSPLLLAAMSEAALSEAGLISGVVNTTSLMGGTLGLSILVSVAASHTSKLIDSGANTLAALNSGYHLAFFVSALIALFAFLNTVFLYRQCETESPSVRRAT